MMAFQEAKETLAKAPVLGHPIQGSPYRLYTDTSDIALGACLQQVQPITIGDLKGSPVYDRLMKAWEVGASIPNLFHSLTPDIKEGSPHEEWGVNFH